MRAEEQYKHLRIVIGRPRGQCPALCVRGYLAMHRVRRGTRGEAQATIACTERSARKEVYKVKVGGQLRNTGAHPRMRVVCAEYGGYF